MSAWEITVQGSQISNKQTGASTGRYVPGPDNAVVSEDLTRVLAPGHEGMGWCAKRGFVPLGYLDDAEKTRRTFLDIEGVRHSVPGDRARLLADGSIELHGRDSVTINSGGEKIFAEEVEHALKHDPAVYDAVVAGRPSERWGQEVVAVVQLRSGAAPDEASLLAECAKHLARYKLPKAFVFRETIVYLIWLLLLNTGLLIIANRANLPGWRNAARGISMMVFGLLISLLMLELLMRFYFGVCGSLSDKIAYLYSMDEILAATNRYQGYPYINYGLSPNHPEHNRYGFRGQNFEEPKPGGVYRIFTLGGSTTFGASLSPRQAYPAQLQQVLREDYGYSNIEVVLITAHSSVDSAVQAMKKGATDDLEKPINFDELFLEARYITGAQLVVDGGLTCKFA